MDTKTTSASQVLLAGFFWGTSGTISAFFPISISPLTIGALRLTVGSLALLLYLTITNHGKPFSHTQRLPLTLIVITAFGMAITQVALFFSVRLAGVTIATMIFIGTPPLFCGLFSAIVRKEYQSRAWLVCALIVAGGCIGMAFSEGISNHPESGAPVLQGSLIALLAGAGWAMEGLCIKEIQKKATPVEASTLVLLAGSIVLFPIAAAEGLSWLGQASNLGLSLALGVVSAALPYVLFSLGMKHLPPEHAFIYGLTEPITASLLGILLLKERLSATGIIGYGFVILGLVCFSIWEIKGKGKKGPI